MSNRLIALLLFLVASVATASDNTGAFGLDSKSVGQPTSRELYNLRNQLNLSSAPIKNQQQLVEYLARTQDGSGPLDRLSPQGKSVFIGSLRFGSESLASMNFDVLRAELDPREIHAILELFGWQELFFHTLTQKRLPRDQTTPSSSGDCFTGPGAAGCDDWVKGHCIGWKQCGGPLSGWCKPSQCN